MGIREHKAKIRVMSIIFIIIFALASVYGGWQFLKTNVFGAQSSREVIAEVNGTKIYKDEFEKEFENMKQYSANMLAQKKQQLSQMGVDTSSFQTLPDEVLKQYLIKTLIEKRLLLTSAKDLKVKVSGGDINKQLEAMQKQVGGKTQFLQYIQANGFNLTTFKKELKNEMTISKVQEKIQLSIKVTDEELKKTYERYQYTTFQDQTFEEAKHQLTEMLNNENSTMLVNSYVNKALEKAKIVFKSDEYKQIYDKSKEVVAEKDGYKFMKSNLNERLISAFFSTQEGYSEKQVTEITDNFKTSLEKLIEIKNKAVAAGLKSSPEFTGLDELSDYVKKYYNYIVDTYKPSDSEMLAQFNKNKNEYNIKNTIEGHVVGSDYVASEKDFEEAKKRAEEAMKTITKDNFAAKAKELSQDPGSKSNGGKLGDNIDVSQFVAEFADAVKKAKAGDIIGPIKTEFGYHIIYVQAKDENNENLATVSHILLTPTISDETKKEADNKLANLKSELETKKVTWEQVTSQDKYNFDVKETFKKLSKSDAIPGIGNDTSLSEKLFSAQPNQILDYKASFGTFILVKTSEVAAKEVTFDEVKERVRLELAFEYANKELGSLN